MKFIKMLALFFVLMLGSQLFAEDISSIAKALNDSGIKVENFIPYSGGFGNSGYNGIKRVMDEVVSFNGYRRIVKSWNKSDEMNLGKNIEKWTDNDIDLLEKYALLRIRNPRKYEIDENKRYFSKFREIINSEKKLLNKVVKPKSENEKIEILDDIESLQEIFTWIDNYFLYATFNEKDYKKYNEIAKNKFGKNFEKWNDDDYKLLEDYIKKNRHLYQVLRNYNDDAIERFIKNFKKGIGIADRRYNPRIEDYIKYYTGQWSNQGEYMSLDLSAVEPIIAFTGHKDIYGVKVKEYNENDGKVTIEFNITNEPSKINVWNISLDKDKKNMTIKTKFGTLNYEKKSSEVDTVETRNRIIPDFSKLNPKFLQSIVATPKGGNNFPWGEKTVREWVTIFANKIQDNGKPFVIDGWKVDDNEYTLTIKNKKGEAITLLFVHRLDLTNTNLSMMNIIESGQKAPGYLLLDAWATNNGKMLLGY